MTHDEMIAVIQAHKEGKRIALRNRGAGSGWEQCNPPMWDFASFDYRVAREPRKRWVLWGRDPGQWIVDCRDSQPTDPTGWQEVTEQL